MLCHESITHTQRFLWRLKTQHDLPCSFVQAQAAAQAGVSVIQPNVGRIMDWYKKHPGYIRNQKVSLLVCCSSISASVEQASCEDWHSQAVTAARTKHHYLLTSCESNSLVCKQGPRQDGGSLFDNDNPGVQLAERIYNYCGKYHPKTKVMVAGFRNKAGKSSLSFSVLFLPASTTSSASFA